MTEDLRLFQVVESETVTHYFKNKKAAKKFRDSLKDKVVSLGPDHWRFDIQNDGFDG